jgi:hypothetical protein
MSASASSIQQSSVPAVYDPAIMPIALWNRLDYARWNARRFAAWKEQQAEQAAQEKAQAAQAAQGEQAQADEEGAISLQATDLKGIMKYNNKKMREEKKKALEEKKMKEKIERQEYRITVSLEYLERAARDWAEEHKRKSNPHSWVLNPTQGGRYYTLRQVLRKRERDSILAALSDEQVLKLMPIYAMWLNSWKTITFTRNNCEMTRNMNELNRWELMTLFAEYLEKL